MELAMIGLGRMGGNMARRLARGGHRIVAYNRTPDKALELAQTEPNVEPVTALAELVAQLTAPRAAWVMVPAGDATEQMIDTLLDLLTPGDIIIDGGNSQP